MHTRQVRLCGAPAGMRGRSVPVKIKKTEVLRFDKIGK